MTDGKPVYLAWQSPESRDWHVVGALTEKSNAYEFNYTKGVYNAKTFVPFSGMEDLEKSYVSKNLFPLFQNRLLSTRRPEYPSFIKWLGLSEQEARPVDILARSGGVRATDHLQMFRRIDIDESGVFEHVFFVHGLSHLSKSAQKRVDTLSVGDELFLCHDCQNKYDHDALLVRADKPAEIVGYCPRYLVKDIKSLLRYSDSMSVLVESISVDAPTNYRLMCRVTGKVNKDNIGNFIVPEDYHFIV
ncbi:TPA: HIRAN domain-containing protein [Vibrio cholerae]|nr:restriction endonuclease [Vibrio cholerae]EGR0778223.1 restriction endonuclease [Vibrio cholerae]EGR0781355.1 restriction endonuclease [Vibrio cholerae]EGR0821393.1 restriction endonuclease [Vibrio cholerae]EGR0830597.1 restriction endonuclease [Vibrio cholerae]